MIHSPSWWSIVYWEWDLFSCGAINQDAGFAMLTIWFQVLIYLNMLKTANNLWLVNNLETCQYVVLYVYFCIPSSGNWILKEIMVSGDSQCVFSAYFATHDSWQIWTWYCWKTTSALGDLIFHYSASFTDKNFSGMRSLQKYLFFSLFPLSLYIVLRHCVKMRPCISTRGSISLDNWFIIIIS